MEINAAVIPLTDHRAIHGRRWGADDWEGKMSKREAYEHKLQAQLDEWAAEIQKLKARAERAEAEAQLEYYRQIDRLKEEQQKAQAQLDELRQASEQAWDDLRAGVERAWEDFGQAVKKATSRFE
jgi:hypothetical protein